jgi:hypothetical protein
MAKRDQDRSSAEDYIEQLQWQSRHRRRVWPVRYMPKWKYKIVYRHQPVTPLSRGIGIAGLVAAILLVIYFLASDWIAQPGEKIFFSLVIFLIVLILFFAVRDASGDQDGRS